MQQQHLVRLVQSRVEGPRGKLFNVYAENGQVADPDN